MEELVKVFECLLKRSISVHLAECNTLIDTTTKPLILLELLCKQREINKQLEKEKELAKERVSIHAPVWGATDEFFYL